MHIDPKEFIRVWQGSNSAVEVGKHFGSNSHNVRSAAHRLRRKGVSLKNMDRNAGKSATYRTVDTKEFVRVWQTSRSAVEVGKYYGIPPETVSQKAAYLRKRGVPLKRMPTRVTKADYTELRRLAEELLHDEA